MQLINKNPRVFLVSLVSLYIVISLFWQHFTTGVPAHHLLNDPELPAISNWWGLLILPVLTGFLTSLITKRHGVPYPKKVWLQILATSIYALAMTLLFYSGHITLVSQLALPLIVVSALFFPVYQAPFILAYVVVSSAGFGAFIPTLFCFIFAAIAYGVHHFIRPIPIWFYHKFVVQQIKK